MVTKGQMAYLKVINDPEFRKANVLVHEAKARLMSMGLSDVEAYDWIKAWSSGAGDGIQ